MAASMGSFDMGFNIPVAFGSIAMDGDEYVRCSRCSFGGCDVRVSGCGCTLHTRCLELNPEGSLAFCPQCHKPTQGLVLFPMSFREIDEARRAAAALNASKNRGKKRKGGAGSEPVDDTDGYISERRTGRWTNEEMLFCDKLMACFSAGTLPVADGVKLNEFLGSMLKSKQSRLTKKMKNAKLSTKLFQRSTGVMAPEEAREFSELEESFFQAVQDLRERAEIKFHMQKEWREQFTQVCASFGQSLEADAWLSSVEEMDRRESQAKDAARMAKRKLMMGVALKADSSHIEHGVFIERTEAEEGVLAAFGNDATEEMFAMLAADANYSPLDVNGKSSLLHSAPFLSKITSYLQRHNVPFEHADLWVPSFVAGDGLHETQQASCRLCYAGSATTEKMVEEDGKTSRAMSPDMKFNLYAFGDYSQKFSFDVGCGLPGRVYESGRPTWEQSVHNAPHRHFERCGGALQWGIKTVVGVPIASPNVGRIVVVLYSCHDRPKDEDLVLRLSEEFTKLMPYPKWKLVVDIGDPEENMPMATASVASSANTQPTTSVVHQYQDVAVDHSRHSQVHPSDFKEHSAFSMVSAEQTPCAVATSHPPRPDGGKDPRIDQVIALLGEFMPSDPHTPSANYLSGFMSLRLLLLRSSRSLEEEEYVRTILESYSSYTAGGRNRADIALMLARDFIFLSQQQSQPFLGYGQNLMASNAATTTASSGLSLFGLPSTSSSQQNSPALTPIPAPGTIDSMSIVSN